MTGFGWPQQSPALPTAQGTAAALAPNTTQPGMLTAEERKAARQAKKAAKAAKKAAKEAAQGIVQIPAFLKG